MNPGRAPMAGPCTALSATSCAGKPAATPTAWPSRRNAMAGCRFRSRTPRPTRWGSCKPTPPRLPPSSGFSPPVTRHGDPFDPFPTPGHLSLRWLDPLQQQDDQAAHAGQVTAPMPGKVVALLVNPGDEVKAGQPLVVTEAMKMEHTLTAPRDGRVAELLCRVGDQVPEGAELLRIESE